MNKEAPQTGHEQLDHAVVGLEFQNAAMKQDAGYEEPSISLHEKNSKYDSYRALSKEADDASGMDVKKRNDHVKGIHFREYGDDGRYDMLSVNVDNYVDLFGVEYRSKTPSLQYDIGLNHTHATDAGEKPKLVRYHTSDDYPELVGVYRARRVNPKTGYIEEPVVKELTGSRAEKAREILKRRAARKILEATDIRQDVIDSNKTENAA